MSIAKKAEVIFEKLGNDPLSWLEEARALKLSARVIECELSKVISLPQTSPGVREKKLAFLHSFMLLTGFAFENLVQGILVAKNPGVANGGKLSDSAWKAKGGHGVSTFAADVASLDTSERDLLQRLEEYVEWAGRYAIPNNANKFVNAIVPRNRREYYLDDVVKINCLFERLCTILQTAIAAPKQK